VEKAGFFEETHDRFIAVFYDKIPLALGPFSPEAPPSFMKSGWEVTFVKPSFDKSHPVLAFSRSDSTDFNGRRSIFAEQLDPDLA